MRKVLIAEVGGLDKTDDDDGNAADDDNNDKGAEDDNDNNAKDDAIPCSSEVSGHVGRVDWECEEREKPPAGHQQPAR